MPEVWSLEPVPELEFELGLEWEWDSGGCGVVLLIGSLVVDDEVGMAVVVMGGALLLGTGEVGGLCPVRSFPLI